MIITFQLSSLIILIDRMSESNISSSLIYKIKQQRDRRSTKCENSLSSSNKINFYLTYEEFYKNQKDKQIEGHKIKLIDKLRPLKAILPIEKLHKLHEKGGHAKKISLNFDFFNPRKKSKEENEESRANYEQLFIYCKQKYYQKIERQRHKKSQKCKNINAFGLNIKTMDSSQKHIKKRESRTKDTIKRKISNQTIKEYYQCEIKPKQPEQKTISTIQKPTKSENRCKSKSFVLVQDKPNRREMSFIKIKMFNMINSSNLVLQSFGRYLNQDVYQKKYKFFVGNGNNRNLIKSILKQRWWWVETNEISNAHLVWTQLKHVPSIERQQNLDQQASFNFVTDQSLNYRIDDRQKSKKDIFFHNNLPHNLQKILTDFERKSILLSFDQPSCVTNHFSSNFMFGNKSALFQNLSYYCSYHKRNLYDIIPVTFFIEDIQSASFEQFTKIAAQQKNSIWIVKPGQNSNRGNGIFVVKSVQQIKRKLSKRKNVHTYIIQKYITNPLLYHKRKFDIRTYLLMISIGGVSKFFWYNEGYIRTSSCIFDLSNLADTFIHLTNDAIQKRSEEYGKFQNGNKLTFNQFQRYLDSTHPDKGFSMKELNQEMKRIARLSVNATYNKLDPLRKAYGFELFGLDFMVDSSFKPFLIEVNTNPCLQLSSPILQRLIPRMLENLFRIAVDPIFQGRDSIPKSMSYYIYEDCLDKNQFELIFDSLYDRDYEWEQRTNKLKEKVYEEVIQQFDGDGEEVNSMNAIY